jgi:hypothetical protein
MRRSRPDRTMTSHSSPAYRLAQSMRATSFDEPSALTACRFVSARGRTPANETRWEEFCFVGLMFLVLLVVRQRQSRRFSEARWLHSRRDYVRVSQGVCSEDGATLQRKVKIFQNCPHPRGCSSRLWRVFEISCSLGEVLEIVAFDQVALLRMPRRSEKC